MPTNWKIISASVPGTAHLRRDAACQDAFAFRIFDTNAGEILTIAVADGAGSAKFAKEGARSACDFFVSGVAALLENGGKVLDLNEEFFFGFLKALTSTLTASGENADLNDYACTFLAVAASETEAVFAQIGDGAIVYSCEPDDFRLFAVPQQGEYANTTNFVTDKTASENLQFKYFENRIEELAIFTDGLQRLAIDFQSKQPHQPFFRSMLAPLRAKHPATNLEEKLSAFLNSPKINERTDDDKTLILASRFKNE
ncbi:MAG TPA: PP2C family serine/threonine-protein phosphatase [Pyrinomonadaceae bacterium]|nr:PP2C family serine/threonine-protein phosphatase [Pyrinomonadaceae bacterium]